jgi:hypothetical protein
MCIMSAYDARYIAHIGHYHIDPLAHVRSVDIRRTLAERVGININGGHVTAPHT